MANGHGGARAGAGRKSKAEKFPEVFAAVDERLAAGVHGRLDKLEYLADGGFEQIEEYYEPAGLIQINKVVETKEGTIRVTELAFPHLDPEQPVLVRSTRRIATPDLKANIYLVDRFLGKPTQATEISGPDGTPVPVSILDALDRVYGSSETEDGD